MKRPFRMRRLPFILLCLWALCMLIGCESGEQQRLQLGGHPYAPARPWYINQNDNVLTLPDFEEDYTLQLLDEDGYVVYSVDCLSGTTQVVLPSTLTGDYEIMVIRGGSYYVGYIEL